MAALSKKLRSIEGDRIGFWCPGCDEMHVIVAAPGRWTFDGNVDAPTFSPSILVRGWDFTEKGRADYEAWCAAGHPKREGAPGFDSRPTVCHCFVRAGQIQFLGDCTHAAAGKTVELPDFPAGLE
jgi:hypothetical protein